MKTKILSKLTARVWLDESIDHAGKPLYTLYKKNYEGSWVKILSTNKMARALHTKHNAYTHEIYRLGLTGRLLERRKKRAKI